MKLSFVSLLRVINEKQTDLSHSTLLFNSKVSNIVNNRIGEIQSQYYTSLYPYQRQAVTRELINSRHNIETIDGYIESINLNDPSTEITETRLDRMKYESQVESTKKVGNLLNHIFGNLGSEYNKLTGMRDRLNKAHGKYTELHINNVNAGMEIDKLIEENNRGSLVSDYADPNTEMPSYMDPED